MTRTRTGRHRSTTRSAAPAGRLDWVDVAKGLSIILVVLHHAVMFLEPHGLVPGPVAALNLALTSLRMPLFLLASGLFLAPVLERGWRTLLHRRVALFLWLYLLWTVVQFAVITPLPTGTAPDFAVLDAADLPLVLLYPDPSMWFLYALALYSVAARLLRRVPGSLLLVATGVLSTLVGAGILEFGWHAWELTARYAFFFVLGWHGRRLVERVAARSTLLWVLTAAVLAVAVAAASVLLDLHDVPGVAFVLNLVAVTGGVLAAAQLARWRIGRGVAALGRRTLPIYLANVPLVALLTALLASTAPPVAVQYGIVALVTAGAVALSLALHRGLIAIRAGWFYDLPGQWAVRPRIG
ncbi:MULTISPECIES: acyltransferase family protein [Pseudonocardia]|uniref:Inner membrane protein YcfT n=2 Tax=Pseudonocardia TaxID=1847 RepID=A0A1Y2N5Q0_PSEAH|nr:MULTISPECIES: acyltransferase family protein [Pseudonocardia]OSY42489.1 Inner membrane protein YcfT [Pseudonocardia autotrophica]TDN76008.1 acyltransferase-like protein [Pseudonocardia autotrophica]BBF99984.1 acyltransferase [Pseudonocardia autotrophica]GEC25044.1 acyltransferase [Pseudonocardia saturnea]